MDYRNLNQPNRQSGSDSLRLLTQLATGVFGVTKNVIFGSLAIAIAMLVACVADIVTGVPFGGNLTPDIIFMIAAAAVT